MKAFICVFIGLFVYQQVEAFSEKDLEPSDLYCLQKLNIDKSVILNAYDRNDLIREGNPQFNAVFLCAWKQDGLRNELGYLLVNRLQDYVEQRVKIMYPTQDSNHLATKSVDTCKGVTGTDDGDSSVKIYNCIVRKIADIVTGYDD